MSPDAKGLLLSLLCALLLLAAPPCPAAGPSGAGAAPLEAGVKEPGELASARAAVEAHPESAPAQIRLGYLLLSSAALEEALGHFDQALSCNPNAFEAKTGRGLVLMKMERLQEAEQALRGALLLNPNPVRIHYQLGLLYQKLGDYEKAAAQFKEGIRKHEQGRI